MIKKEYFMTRSDGVKLYRTYSTLGYKIKQFETNEIYDEAIDIESVNYSYLETDEQIETDEDIEDTK